MSLHWVWHLLCYTVPWYYSSVVPLTVPVCMCAAPKSLQFILFWAVNPTVCLAATHP